jgi:hypothetical protein
MELKIVARVPESDLVPGEDVIAVICVDGFLLGAINTKAGNGVIKVIMKKYYFIVHAVKGKSAEPVAKFEKD